MMRLTNPAFILGMFETGLGVVRSLGRNGISVNGYNVKKDIGFYSKYVRAKICPSPVTSEKEFIDFLIREAGKFSNKPVLYITSDDYISAVAENIEVLKERFLLAVPPKEIINSIKNKYSQYKLALNANISVPETVFVETFSDIDVVHDKLKFPIFIKGVESTQWRNEFGGTKKGFVCANFEQLRDIIKQIIDKKIQVIAQELIAGDDSKHYKFCGYADNKGEILAGFCLRKIRQNPVNFGVGCIVESVDNKKLMETGMRFFKAINYIGTGSAEFKLDERDGEYKLIELNPRYWQQNSLAEACGINFPLIQYLDLTGQNVNKSFDYKTGFKWVNIYSDFDSFLAYKRKKKLTFMNWLKSLKGEKVFSDYAKDDILPSFYEIRFGKRLFNIPLYIKKKLFRNEKI